MAKLPNRPMAPPLPFVVLFAATYPAEHRILQTGGPQIRREGESGAWGW